MDQEAEVHVVIWQKIRQAQMLWVHEIGSRLDVNIPMDTTDRLIGIDEAIGENNSDQADQETQEIVDSVELIYENICSELGDPCDCKYKYRTSADLWGREPLQAIIETSLHFIDVVLIGPKNQVAALLADDPRLLAATRTRWLYLPEDDGWAMRIREILARTDSIIARNAVDGVVGGA